MGHWIFVFIHSAVNQEHHSRCRSCRHSVHSEILASKPYRKMSISSFLSKHLLKALPKPALCLPKWLRKSLNPFIPRIIIIRFPDNLPSEGSLSLSLPPHPQAISCCIDLGLIRETSYSKGSLGRISGEQFNWNGYRIMIGRRIQYGATLCSL